VGDAAAGADPRALIARASAALLSRAGDEPSARLEAEVLLASVLGCERSVLARVGAVSGEQVRALETLVARRRVDACPVAYLTHRRGFYDLELYVDERVLVPRPETEHVVEVLLALDAEGLLPPGPVLDRGTGSGALALALAGALPGRRTLVGSDVSAAALEVADLNRRRCGRRLMLLQADGLGALRPASLAGIVCNPPYIAPAEHGQLPPDVRDHEPRVALVPGEGSVPAVYERLAREAVQVLRPGGWLVTEMGAGQADLVRSACLGAGLDALRVTSDLAGIPRVVAARRAA